MNAIDLAELDEFVSEELRERLSTLEANGAADFDPPLWMLVGRLLERATTVHPLAKERLVVRATKHLDRLEERFLKALAVAKEEDEAQAGDEPVKVVPIRKEWVDRLATRAREQGVPSSPGEIAAGDALELSEKLYNVAVESSRAKDQVERALDSIPPDSGRYHGAAVAAYVLDEAGELAASYLRTTVRKLDVYSEMFAFIDAVNFEVAAK